MTERRIRTIVEFFVDCSPKGVLPVGYFMTISGAVKEVLFEQNMDQVEDG